MAAALSRTSATIIALLVNPTNPTNAETISRDMQAAARTLRLQLHVLHASTERDFDAVFASLPRLRAGALVIGSDPFFNSRSQQLAALALHHAIRSPTVLTDSGKAVRDLYRRMEAEFQGAVDGSWQELRTYLAESISLTE